MNRVGAGLLTAALLAMASESRAQVFGQFTGAQPLAVNAHLFGAYVHLSDNELGALAQLRLSFYPAVDFGFQGGLSRLDSGQGGDSRTALSLGTDVKFAVANANPSLPADIAVGATLGVRTGDGFTVVSLGPTVVASRSMGSSSGTAFVPYAGLGLLFSNLEVKGASNTDFSIPVRIGADFQANPQFRVVGEVQLLLGDDFNDDVRVVLGANLPF